MREQFEGTQLKDIVVEANGDDELAHEEADAKKALIVESMRETNKARQEKEVEVKLSKSVRKALA